MQRCIEQKATKATKGTCVLRSLRLLLCIFPNQDFNPNTEVRPNRSKRRGPSQRGNPDRSTLTAFVSVPSCAGCIARRAQSKNLTL